MANAPNGTNNLALTVSYETAFGEVTITSEDVKKYLVRGGGNITDQEIKLFMELCKYQRLNPFTGEAYPIKFGNDFQLVVGYEAYKRRAEEHDSYMGRKSGIVVLRGNDVIQKEGTCLYPGEELIGSNNSLHCGDCDTESDYYTCCECESRYHEDDMHCINGDWYCNDCCGFCDSCEERTIGEITSAYNRRGSEISVCEECLSDHYIRCDECYEYCHQDTVEHIEAGIICNECLRSRFVECYGCDEYVRHDDTEELDGELYCMSCAEDVREEMKENANCTAWA